MADKVSFTEKVGYALGDAGSGGITWKIMSTCFPFFFTNVFGLSFADAAALMLIARVFDVITDPILGSLADRTQSRWGVYRPWLIFGAIPYGLVFALLLFTPDFGEAGKRVYAYTLYLLMMVLYTAVNVPYGSLLGVMTADDNQKNQFSSFRMVGAYAMGFITLFAFPYVQKWVSDPEAYRLVEIQNEKIQNIKDQINVASALELELTKQIDNKEIVDSVKESAAFMTGLRQDPASTTRLAPHALDDTQLQTLHNTMLNGRDSLSAVEAQLLQAIVNTKHLEVEQQLLRLEIMPIQQPMERHQYAMIGLLFGILAAAMTLACGLLTKERIKPKRAEKFELKQFVNLFRNKPWVCLTTIGVLTNFFNGFRYAVAAYMFDYCLDGNVTVGSFIINYTVFMSIGEVTCMIFGAVSPWFTKLIGSKRMAFTYAAALCLVTSVLFFFIPMEKSSIWMMILVSVLTSVGVGIYSPLLWSMYADVADFATEKFGTSSTGLIFSSGTMAQKLGGAISGSLIALLLGVAGLTMMTDATGNEIVNPASVTPAVKEMIWALFSLFPALMALLMGIMTYFFPLKK